MKEETPQHEHYAREHKDAKTIAKLSGQLAPPEERDVHHGRDQRSRENDGGIVLDTGSLKIPKGFIENEEAKRGLFGLEPVIVVILILMMAFIAVIAYLVYLMPTPVK